MTTTQPENTSDDARPVNATFTLTMRGRHRPELRRAEAQARLRFAAAIHSMYAAEDVPGHHNLNEQAAVELAKDAYAQALADLIRGDAG
ncbi:hypothetical protein [Arthrobacter rhizosphaerae]|uniref:hypothetical protein n=1 Tax=Arthrobacter rhizosphaerae TaxID=2855490 RepID=UPI001FF493D8|nr:hypothetical protein [Arthrobacter rhizosphaerae]